MAMEPIVTAYLTLVLEVSREAERAGLRNLRELRTLAKCLDLLLSGQVAQAADALMQRFKAVETASRDGGWEIVQGLELDDFLSERLQATIAELEEERALVSDLLTNAG